MDRGTQERNVNMRVDKGISALLLLALLLLGAGCHQDERAGAPASLPATEEVSGDNTAAVPEWLHPAVAVDGPQEAAGTSPADNTAADNTAAVGPETAAAAACSRGMCGASSSSSRS